MARKSFALAAKDIGDTLICKMAGVETIQDNQRDEIENIFGIVAGVVVMSKGPKLVGTDTQRRCVTPQEYYYLLNKWGLLFKALKEIRKQYALDMLEIALGRYLEAIIDRDIDKIPVDKLMRSAEMMGNLLSKGADRFTDGSIIGDNLRADSKERVQVSQDNIIRYIKENPKFRKMYLEEHEKDLKFNGGLETINADGED